MKTQTRNLVIRRHRETNTSAAVLTKEDGSQEIELYSTHQRRVDDVPVSDDLAVFLRKQTD